MKIDIKKGLKAFSNGTVRVVLSTKKVKKVEYVEYKVLFHSQASRIGKIHTIKRSSFVKWLDGVKYDKEQYKPGDILLFDEMQIQVLENNGIYGTVRDINNPECTMNRFYWSGSDEISCIKIGYTPILRAS